jgi:hypothetical protein
VYLDDVDMGVGILIGMSLQERSQPREMTCA